MHCEGGGVTSMAPWQAAEKLDVAVGIVVEERPFRAA